MGLDFASSLRPALKHDASALSTHGDLSGSLQPWHRRLSGDLKRSSQAEPAGEGYKSGIFLNGDKSCCWRGSNSYLYQERSFHLPSAGSSCHGFAANAGVGIPLSLQMLKKKQQYLGKAAVTTGLLKAGNSLVNAFSTMVLMMKELQSHCLHIQCQFFKKEIEGILIQVHKEMQSSFLWLFQQVFSCTPELMMLLMVLLANFTSFSMASIMPTEKVLSMSTATPSLVGGVHGLLSHVSGSGTSIKASVKGPTTSSLSLADKTDPPLEDDGWMGNGGKRSHRGYTAVGNGDGEFNSSKVFSSVNNQLYTGEDSNTSTEMSSLSTRMCSLGKAMAPCKEGFNNEAVFLSKRQIQLEDEFSSMAAALAFEELNSEDDIVSGSSSSELDPAALRVHSSHSVGLTNQSDGHSCYDRTDLAYQHALIGDASNSMLLANYAQFLYLVRKDHNRAEELFNQAVRCDPLDGNAISRFASFLWIARHNLSAAGKAYQEALRADPCNSFHAADYAHFLWNSDQ